MRGQTHGAMELGEESKDKTRATKKRLRGKKEL